MPLIGMFINRGLNFNLFNHLPNNRPLFRSNPINLHHVNRNVLRNSTNHKALRRNINHMRNIVLRNVRQRIRRLNSRTNRLRSTNLGNIRIYNNINRKRVTKIRKRHSIIFQLNRPLRGFGTNPSLNINTFNRSRTNALLNNSQTTTHGK